jgi:hypothetical protein
VLIDAEKLLIDKGLVLIHLHRLGLLLPFLSIYFTKFNESSYVEQLSGG